MGAVRELQIYDGRDRIGRIVVDGEKATAYNVKGRSLGTFADVKAAANAIEAARKRRKVAA
jgi:hypothetical protein